MNIAVVSVLFGVDKSGAGDLSTFHEKFAATIISCGVAYSGTFWPSLCHGFSSTQAIRSWNKLWGMKGLLFHSHLAGRRGATQNRCFA